MANKKIHQLAFGSILCAMVLLLTYIIKIPVPATGGYVHLGDGMIFFSSLLLGPYAGFVAAIGSALADLIGGYFIYVLPTFIIKGAMGIVCGLLKKKNTPLRNFFTFTLAEILMVLGYFFFESILYGWATAALAIPPNLLQGLFGITVGMILFPISNLPLINKK